MAKATKSKQAAHYSFFESVERNFDKAAPFTNIKDKGILDQIKACNSVYSMKFRLKSEKK